MESFQPYHAGHGNTPLEWLAWLSNTDKHRLVLATASTGENFVPHFLKARAGYAIRRSEFGYTGLLEDGTEIGRLLVEPTNSELQVDMQGSPSVGVAFGDPDAPMFGREVHSLLEGLFELAEGMIRLFDRPGASGAPPWP
ncbi:MAG: hypothetical protein M3321_09115 [Actinomycetota bacterium]|nr:hypothetical protein [Actinomycetota bacterium]